MPRCSQALHSCRREVGGFRPAPASLLDSSPYPRRRLWRRLFSLNTDIYGFFLQPNFINYEPAPAIVGSGAKKPPWTASEITPMRANDSKSSGVGSVLLGVVAIALAGMVGTIGLIHQVGELGPKVGDIVVFDPLDSMSRDMQRAACPPCRPTAAQESPACWTSGPCTPTAAA